MQRRGVRSLLWLAVLTASLALWACGPAEPAPPPRAQLTGSSKLVAIFHEAEAATGVPAEVLATVAYLQTRLTESLPADDHDASAHSAPAYGLMAIGSGGLTTLQEASAVSGYSETEVAHDTVSNVRAAALMLRARRGEDASYARAIATYGGPSLAEQVLRLLADGWSNTDDAGESVQVTGHGAPSEFNDESGLGTVQQALGYPGAIWNPAYSGNYTNASRGAAQINYVVIHTTQGSYSGAISWFKNASSNVSAHYVVRSSDGQITQSVDDADIAWHDACFNSQSIGIEHEGYVADPGKWYTQAMYQSSAKLTAWLCDKYGIPKDRNHILGHGEAPDCSDHTDPGGGWNWNLYMDLVKNGACKPTGCSGSKLVSSCGQGDCAAYGATCVNDSLGPRCVSVFCPAKGTAKACIDDTKIIDCKDGQPSTPGNCAAYGAKCVSDSLGARCVSVFCPAKGSTKACIDDTKIIDCKNGLPSEPGDCGAFAAFCSTAGAKAARCVSAFCVAGPEEVPTDKDVCLPNGELGHCGADASLTSEKCPANQPCTLTAQGAQCGGVPVGSGGSAGSGSAGTSGSANAGASGDAGAGGSLATGGNPTTRPERFDDAEGSCGCTVPGRERQPPSTLALLALLGLGLARRRFPSRANAH